MDAKFVILEVLAAFMISFTPPPRTCPLRPSSRSLFTLHTSPEIRTLQHPGATRPLAPRQDKTSAFFGASPGRVLVDQLHRVFQNLIAQKSPCLAKIGDEKGLLARLGTLGNRSASHWLGTVPGVLDMLIEVSFDYHPFVPIPSLDRIIRHLFTHSATPTYRR